MLAERDRLTTSRYTNKFPYELPVERHLKEAQQLAIDWSRAVRNIRTKKPISQIPPSEVLMQEHMQGDTIIVRHVLQSQQPLIEKEWMNLMVKIPICIEWFQLISSVCHSVIPPSTTQILGYVNTSNENLTANPTGKNT